MARTAPSSSPRSSRKTSHGGRAEQRARRAPPGEDDELVPLELVASGAHTSALGLELGDLEFSSICLAEGDLDCGVGAGLDNGSRSNEEGVHVLVVFRRVWSVCRGKGGGRGREKVGEDVGGGGVEGGVAREGELDLVEVVLGGVDLIEDGGDVGGCGVRIGSGGDRGGGGGGGGGEGVEGEEVVGEEGREHEEVEEVGAEMESLRFRSELIWELGERDDQEREALKNQISEKEKKFTP